MLTEICQYLKNWFDRDLHRFEGEVTIEDGYITMKDGDITLLDGQYFRIMGSVYNDGVHDLNDSLRDETFEGIIQLMAVPQALSDMVVEIEAWRDKFEDINGAAMSPYQNESFSGYSYSKSASGTASWQAAFSPRLAQWRKI